MKRRVVYTITMVLVALLTVLSVSAVVSPSQASESQILDAFIVQSSDRIQARALVEEVGGEITHELGIIDAVGARLSARQRERLEGLEGVGRVYRDGVLRIARGTPQPDTFYPTILDANDLHEQDILGSGVTVAVLDTGTWEGGQISKNVKSQFRIKIHYDAINDTEGLGSDDDNGHGTHVTSVILSSGKTKKKKGQPRLFSGMAPDADLVVVRGFDVNGNGVYSNVIRGLDWVLDHQALYDIRVLNLSFSAPARSYYWDDPLNQAVMRVWQAGIVVVAAAGDAGSGPLGVTVPGNVPYVITVGATAFMDPDSTTDDFLAPFSSAGPTAEAFVKPDLVAPGYLIRGVLRNDQVLAQTTPYLGADNYELSGTSQAAAIVSGVVALMLQVDPTLDPDTVKCRLTGSARPAVDDPPGPNPPELAYSVFQQGAGQVNALDAVNSTMSGCANQGLDIAKDLDDTEHYHGLADQDGVYFLTNRAMADYEWDGTLQSGTFPFAAGFSWVGGFPFGDGTFVGPFPFIGPAPDPMKYDWQSTLSWINDPYPQVWSGNEPVAAHVWPP